MNISMHHHRCQHMTETMVANATSIASRKHLFAKEKCEVVCVSCEHYGYLSNFSFQKHLLDHHHNICVRIQDPVELYCSICGDYRYSDSFDMHMKRKMKFEDPQKNANDFKVAKQNNLRFFRGICNMGSTCFMGSILQIILHNPIFRYYFVNGFEMLCGKDQLEGIQTADDDSAGTNGCIACEMCKLVKDSVVRCDSAASTVSIVPSNLLFSVWNHADYLAGYDQQDAHEFLIALLDGLDTHLVKHHSSSNPQPQDQGQHSPVQGSGSFVQNTFAGVMRSDLHCMHCGNRSCKYESFLDLSLSLEPEQQNTPRGSSATPFSWAMPSTGSVKGGLSPSGERTVTETSSPTHSLSPASPAALSPPPTLRPASERPSPSNNTSTESAVPRPHRLSTEGDASDQEGRGMRDEDGDEDDDYGDDFDEDGNDADADGDEHADVEDEGNGNDGAGSEVYECAGTGATESGRDKRRGDQGRVSVYDCMRSFTCMEKLAGEVRCDRCGVNRPCKKQLSVHRPPRILVLQLKRFDPMKQIKLSTCVEFPLRGLDLGPFMRTQESPLSTPRAHADPAALSHESGGSGPLGKVVDMTADNIRDASELNEPVGSVGVHSIDDASVCYDLMGVGHYISYVAKGVEPCRTSGDLGRETKAGKRDDERQCANEEARRWFRCDDDHVTEVDENSVAEAEGYILFYVSHSAIQQPPTCL